MYWASPIMGDGLSVCFCQVSFVGSPPILWVLGIKLFEQSIAVRFGQDRGCGDGIIQIITSYDTLMGHKGIGLEAVTVY